MAKLVARLLATAVGMQTSLKNKTWATKAKEWPTHSSLPKKYTKKKRSKDCLRIVEKTALALN
jgi:hypothetical protein